jgi:hypothetical protein
MLLEKAGIMMTQPRHRADDLLICLRDCVLLI